jgi:hypothetical protein
MSLQRKVGAWEDFHRGSSSHVPFLPGGASSSRASTASAAAVDAGHATPRSIAAAPVLDFDLQSLIACMWLCGFGDLVCALSTGVLMWLGVDDGST